MRKPFNDCCIKQNNKSAEIINNVTLRLNKDASNSSTKGISLQQKDHPNINSVSLSISESKETGKEENSLKNNHFTKCPIFEVASEGYFSEQIQEIPDINKSIDLCLKDSRWNLIAGFQSSYVGQFLSYMELLSSLNSYSTTITSNSNNSQNNMKVSAAAWESVLRIKWNDMPMWTHSKSSPSNRQVPMIIRPLLETYNENGIFNSRLAQLFIIAEEFPGYISEWQLFSVFIEESLAQVN